MKVRCDEGVATRIGPEPCVSDREARGEASVGGRIGQPLSCERKTVPGVDVLVMAEGNTGEGVMRAFVRPGEVRDPGMCASSSNGNREISCPSGARAPPDRVGKARSRSRR